MFCGKNGFCCYTIFEDHDYRFNSFRDGPTFLEICCRSHRLWQCDDQKGCAGAGVRSWSWRLRSRSLCSLHAIIIFVACPQPRVLLKENIRASVPETLHNILGGGTFFKIQGLLSSFLARGVVSQKSIGGDLKCLIYLWPKYFLTTY